MCLYYFNILFKKFVFLLSALFFGLTCTSCHRETGRELLSALLNNYNKHKSISYFAKIKDKSDTLFKGYIWLLRRRSPQHDWGRYYDLKNIYHFDDSLKIITVFNKPNDQYWTIKGNTIGIARDVMFLDPSEISNALADTFAISLTNDKINNTICWRINMNLPSNGDYSQRYKTLWIDKADTTIKQIYEHRFHHNTELSTLWCLDSIKFDSESPETLKKLMESRFNTYSNNLYADTNK